MAYPQPRPKLISVDPVFRDPLPRGQDLFFLVPHAFCTRTFAPPHVHRLAIVLTFPSILLHFALYHLPPPPESGCHMYISHVPLKSLALYIILLVQHSLGVGMQVSPLITWTRQG